MSWEGGGLVDGVADLSGGKSSYKEWKLPSGEGGEKNLFLIIVHVLGHPKGVGG